MNYLISPILYKGSCFSDIVDGILDAAKKSDIKFKLMPIVKGKLNSFGLENPEGYFHNSLDKIVFLKNNLKNGDKLLLVDFFFPGLDLLEFYLKRKNISVYKVGLLHGGSFVEGDLYGEYGWLKNFEKGWFDIFDLVISPSNFFIKDLENKYRNKIKVFPWGLNKKLKPELSRKTIDVIFPHRFAHDKGVEDFLLIAKKMKKVNFVLTGFSQEVFNDLPNDLKKIYFGLKKLKNVQILKMEDVDKHIKTLKSAKIVLSTAKQEGFGFSVFKTIQCGAIPVLPMRCCYTEWFDNKYMYSSTKEAIALINKFLKLYPKAYFYPDLKLFNFNKIVKLFK